MGLQERIFWDIQDVAWKGCEEELGYPPGTFADDSARRQVGDDTRQVGLALLRILEEMRRAIDVSGLRAETDAIRGGANYAEIAASKGVSRQAVRQRRKRHVESLKQQKRKVTLVGGPLNGEQTTISEAGKALRTPVSVYPRDPDVDWESTTWVARYVQSTSDKTQFVFSSIEEANQT